MIKTIKTNLLDKDIEVYLPRFYFKKLESYAYFGAVNDMIGGFADDFNCGIKNDYRHISLGEFSDLFDYNTTEKHEILGEIMLSYLLKKGFDLKDHNWMYGIYTNNGIMREGEDLIVFKDIDGKMECITENTYDTIVGYKTKNFIEKKRFNAEKLFKECDKKDITLKHIDKSTPDLIKYLFSKEYEELPQIIQNSRFTLPPDYLNLNDKVWDKKCNIWPISIDISSKINQDSASRIDMNKILIKRTTIYPYELYGGMHLLVKEIKNEGKYKEGENKHE